MFVLSWCAKVANVAYIRHVLARASRTYRRTIQMDNSVIYDLNQWIPLLPVPGQPVHGPVRTGPWNISYISYNFFFLLFWLSESCYLTHRLHTLICSGELETFCELFWKLIRRCCHLVHNMQLSYYKLSTVNALHFALFLFI